VVVVISLALPLHVGANLRGEQEHLKFVAVEPAACPTLTKGKYTYDFGDTAHLTPLVKMHTLGNSFVPEGIHSGGLRSHGTPFSHIVELGLIEPRAEKQLGCFAAGITLLVLKASHLHLKLTMLLKVPLMRHCAVKRKESVKPSCSTQVRYAGVHGLSDGVVA